MTISPIQFPTWQVTSLRDRFSLTDNSTISKSIHQSTFCHHCQDLWRRPLKRTEKITLQFPINFMPTTQLPRIPPPWRLSSVKKPWLKRITHIFSSWRDLKKSSFLKASTSQEDCMTHWTWLGNCFRFILKKVCLKFQLKSLKSITRRDLMKIKMKIRKSENYDPLKFISMLLS